MADEKMIITIGREHGTMGEKIAEKIRRKFDLPLYDKAHLLRAVEGSDEYDELNAFFNDRKVNSLLYAIAMSESVRSNDVPFGIIKNIVGDTGGIVMDSCGNYLFRDRPNTVRIFLHAKKEIRVNNLMKNLGITKEQAQKKLKQKILSDMSFTNIIQTRYGAHLRDMSYVWMKGFLELMDVWR